MKCIYRGNILSSQPDRSVDCYLRGYLVVNDQGVIEAIESAQFRPDPKDRVFDLGQNLIIPGLIDAHTHISQFANCGIGEGSLLSWLKLHTFPQEVRFNEPGAAEVQARTFFETCKSLGTTTVAALITSNTEAVDVSYRQARSAGVRAFLGKVLMDREAPPELVESAQPALAGCLALIEKWHDSSPGSMAQFVVSPRFALSCSSELLEIAGKLAMEKRLPVQTHLSENISEVSQVLKVFSWAESYAEVYDRFGLVGARSLFAHGIHLDTAESRLLAQKNATIVHCPRSNRFLSSGFFPVRARLHEGVNVALGTDVAAGPCLSMLAEMNEARETAKQIAYLEMNENNNISVADTLYMATRAGARALGVEGWLGSLEPGKVADFVVLDDSRILPVPGAPGGYSAHQVLQRLGRIMAINYRNSVIHTIVGGKVVFARENSGSIAGE